jgi:predicted TIM-barrel fold metal-dependent hydrolase
MMLLAALLLAQAGSARPAIRDYHQHLFSPAIQKFRGETATVTAADLIPRMDAAGIGWSLILSNAYMFGNPHRPQVENEYEMVKAENDWTAEQVRQYPRRLKALCGVHPLRDYALQEIDRCAQSPQLRTGLKLHFGNSDVELGKPEHLEKVRAFFRQANRRRMPVLVHLRPNVTHKRPYGAEFARIFLEQVVPEAPDVTIQIAHLAGAGGYDSAQDAALRVFTDAVAKGDARMRRICFDVSGVPGLAGWERWKDTVTQRMRELGLRRVLYGTDASGEGELSPLARWQAWRKYPLTDKEFRAIEQNKSCW